MTKDMLGRDVYPGDLIIKSISNRCSSEILMGVVSPTGKSLICRDYDVVGRSLGIKIITNLKNIFKITNPTELELEEKNDIIEDYERSKSN